MADKLKQIFNDINRKYFKPILGKEVNDLPIKYDRSKYTGGKTWYKFNSAKDAYDVTKITISDFHLYSDELLYGIMAHEMIHAWLGQHTLYNPSKNLVDRLRKGHGPNFTNIVRQLKAHGLIVPMDLDSTQSEINDKYVKDSIIFIAYQTEKRKFILSKINKKNNIDVITKLKKAFELFKGRYSKIIIGTATNALIETAPELRTLKTISWLPISESEYNMLKNKMKDIIFEKD